MNHVNYNEIAFEFDSWMHRKSTPFIDASHCQPILTRSFHGPLVRMGYMSAWSAQSWVGAAKHHRHTNKTHTWQQCLVIISENISKTKYDSDLRYIAPQCWLNGIDNDTNPATFPITEKRSHFVYRPQIPGSDSDASLWMVHKVDPNYDAYRRQNRGLEVV